MRPLAAPSGSSLDICPVVFTYGTGIDAVRIDGRDYIYFSQNFYAFAVVVTATAGQDWSNLGSLTRMDIVDDILKISNGSASVIDGKVFMGLYSQRDARSILLDAALRVRGIFI